MNISTSRPAQSYPSFAVAMVGLIALMLACFFSFLDRQILNLLVQPIKHDLHLTDTEIGILQGLAFAVPYSVMALPFGWMADRFHRFRLICFGMATWCVATLGSGLSSSFTELLIARILVGTGEAALMPAAYSLLADYFPPHQRGRAFAAFMSAIFLGTGGALMAGAFVLQALDGVHVVAVPLLGELAVWKAAFVWVSVPGLVLTLMLLLLKEPARQGHPVEPSGTSSGMIAYIFRHPHAFFAVFGIYVLITLSGTALSSWAPVLLIRNYDISPVAAGMTIGIAGLAASLPGAAISGILGDRWMARSRRGGRLPLTYFMWFGSLPALALFGFAGDVRWAAFGFAAHSLCLGIALVSSSAVLQEMVPGHLRGRATALWYLVTGTVGYGLGPLLTGLLNDHVFRSEAALPQSILTIAGPCAILGLLLTWTGIAAYDRACISQRMPGENKL